MAIVSLKPGITQISWSAASRINIDAQPAAQVPGGLYPLRANAYEVDEYRVMAGWPVSVPAYDIRGVSMISSTGNTFDVRDDPTAIVTDALVRWVADPAFYNSADYLWHPLQNDSGTDLNWQTTPDYAPVYVGDYEYRVKDERFNHGVLNFDSDTQNHMWLDLSTSLGGSSGYTVIMVMSPNSTYGNNVEVPYNGLWCPPDSPGAHWVSVTMQGKYLYLETEAHGRTRAISVSSQLDQNAPLYLAMVFDRPTTTFYAGNGPSSIRVQSVPAGPTPLPLSDSVLLGRSSGDYDHTMDMALFDLGVYADALNGAQIYAEFTRLSAAYGGDS